MEFRKYQHGFRKLIVWQEAHKLALGMYKITASFPKEEKFGLISQMCKAASSVGANIAEGSGRRTAKDQNSFYVIARASLVEVDNFLELAHDLSYLSDEHYKRFLEQVNKVGFLLNRLLHR